ncbi:MAG: hypothetical protein H6909_02925 [Rickettsiaceae bacterium]|nr:hypothetical protein [Rickettsiaceae bacterium]
MLNLILQEIIIHNKIYHITKHFLLFLLFALISTAIISPPQNVTEFGLMLSIIYIPLFLLSNNHFLLKYETHNGDLELLLTTHHALTIIIAKFCALSFSLLISLIYLLPFIIIFFTPSFLLTINFICAAILILLMSNALTIMIAAIQSYFQRNNNFLSALIMPFMLPNIILAGILINVPTQTTLIFMMIGVNLVIIPVSLYCAQYLINNIYNI